MVKKMNEKLNPNDINEAVGCMYDFIDAWKKLLNAMDKIPEFEDAVNYGYSDKNPALSKNQQNSYGLAFGGSFDEAFWEANTWADCVTTALDKYYN